MSIKHLETSSFYPYLTSNNYEETSKDTIKYNCIAWAAGDDTKWWWPLDGSHCYWPKNINGDKVDEFIIVFEELGFEVCSSAEYEDGFEKVAIYADKTNSVKHMARQLDENNWTSKMGKLEDISHTTLEAIEGPTYGTKHTFMRRKK